MDVAEFFWESNASVTNKLTLNELPEGLECECVAEITVPEPMRVGK